MKEETPAPNRNDWIAVGVCILLAIGWSFYAQHRWPAKPYVPPAPVAATAAPIVGATPTLALASVPAAPATPEAPEVRPVLENDQIRVTLTSHGAGIVQVELKQHALAKGGAPVVLNNGVAFDHAPPLPIFAVSGWESSPAAAYEVNKGKDSAPDRVTFLRTLPGGVRIERTYSLDAGYHILLEQRLINPAAQPATLPAYQLEIGTAQALYKTDQASYVSANWSGTNGKYGGIVAPELPFSAPTLGLFGGHPAYDLKASPTTPILWGAVKNRFFTLVLVPPTTNPIQAVVTRTATDAIPLPGIEASARFDAVALAAGETRAENYTLYAGPKDHALLKDLGQGEEKLMQYGMWGWVAVPLSRVMEWMHRYVPNYGWVIILLTLILKGIFWPLQSAANRSMKQMQAVAPKQKELAEKHKDDPQKLQAETMRLYKEYGVNPVGGCLPMLIQIPIFFGFYTMLQSAGQFQHQSWFWVHDLVQPDTIGHLFGVPINPLPIVMALTQFGLMKITPQASDNPQMKVMQFMPLMMLFICYKFASALALYWTVNNLVTGFQTWRNLRKPVPVLQRIKKKKR